MNAPDHPDARAVFERALEVSPPKRAAFLDGACRGQLALRAQVDKLLAAHAEAGEFLNRPAHVAALSEQPGQMIGRYKLLQPIGEGGFGSVWMAEQREPVKRRVALKVIKLGMDTKQVITRFEAERQALALMDHPHIAKVLDAGATDTGRPYFVMELVRGVPIIEYCDRERLDTRARLDLFVGVCHAIQHAHQKGIIHRDIKPSNVLVTLHDGKPVPKVIDFGIAKAINAELTERTLFTEHRQMMGTPAYMSPEQAEMSGLDIDTRADVYSLGVLLYELLTGTTPFDMRELMREGLGAMLRVIREVEPHKPSTRISTLGDTGTRTAEQRHSDVKKLGSLLRGDLDWIVMRCLEKDRSRRYETANGLALDVRRHLDGEPVTAAPPGQIYRLRKIVVRHKRVVAAAALVTVALILGVTGTTIGLVRAKEQQVLAERARDKEKAQRTIADRALKRVEKINQFVQEALISSDPNQGGKQSMLVADAMLQAIAAIDDGAFDDDPETGAELRTTIALILVGNGRPAAALPLAERVLSIRQRLHVGDDAGVADAIELLGIVQSDLGRTREAEPLFVQALEMRQRLFQGDHRQVAKSLTHLACLYRPSRPAEAEPLFVQALEMNRRLLEGDHLDLAGNLSNLAGTLEILSRPAEAEPLLEEVLEMVRRMVAGDDPKLAIALNNLASVRNNLGRLVEADALHQESLEMTQRLFEGDHPDVAISLSNLANTRYMMGRAAEAELLCQQALEMSQRLYPGDHPMVAMSLDQLGSIRLSLGRTDEAEPLLVRALQMTQRLFPGRDHPEVARDLNNLGMLRQSKDRQQEAEPLLEQALEMTQRLFPGAHHDVAIGLVNLANTRLALGRAKEAEPLYVQALEMNQRLRPGDYPGTANALQGLASVYASLDRAAEAELLYVQSSEMQQRLFEYDRLELARTMQGLALVRGQLGRMAEAEPLLVEALEMWRRNSWGDSLELARLLEDLADMWLVLDRVTEVEPLCVESLEINQRLLPGDNANVALALGKLAYVRLLLDRAADAEPVAVQALEMSQRVFAGDHAVVTSALNNVGRAHARLGRPALAEPAFTQALAMQRRMVAGDDANTASILTNLARCLADLERRDEALQLAQEAAAMAARTLPEGHRTRRKCDGHLAEIQALIATDPMREASPRRTGER